MGCGFGNKGLGVEVNISTTLSNRVEIEIEVDMGLQSKEYKVLRRYIFDIDIGLGIWEEELGIKY